LSYLLDINVISELRKGKRANANVTAWFAGVAEEEISLSVLTIGEIHCGIESVRRRDPDSAAALDRWLKVDRKALGSWRVEFARRLPL
jgi:predicted nucleic acid-binding protein